MNGDIQQWVMKFREEWEDEPIEYLDGSGEWQQDSDPLFGSISTAIQSRGYQLTVEELLRISRWKLQSSRNDTNIKKNTSETVTQQTQAALEASTNTEAIEALTELSGVGVPVASTILTVAKPSQYAIIDYRAFRGLVGAKSDIIDSTEYSEYAEFIEHFRRYQKSPESYEYYMNHVREIADTAGLSARQVDMALWAYDKEMT
jgi:endonuclease III